VGPGIPHPGPIGPGRRFPGSAFGMIRQEVWLVRRPDKEYIGERRPGPLHDRTRTGARPSTPRTRTTDHEPLHHPTPGTGILATSGPARGAERSHRRIAPGAGTKPNPGPGSGPAESETRERTQRGTRSKPRSDPMGRRLGRSRWCGSGAGLSSQVIRLQIVTKKTRGMPRVDARVRRSRTKPSSVAGRTQRRSRTKPSSVAGRTHRPVQNQAKLGRRTNPIVSPPPWRWKVRAGRREAPPENTGTPDDGLGPLAP
jgi:hypothetical protein